LRLEARLFADFYNLTPIGSPAKIKSQFLAKEEDAPFI